MHVIGLNGVMEPVNGMLFPSEVVIRLNRLLTLEFTSRGDLSAMFISNLGGSGNSEFVLGENPRAPQPYVTWRHTIGDAPTDFYWGHYFGSYHQAKADLKNRAKEDIQMYSEEKPTSVRAQLAQMQQEQKRASPNPARVQEER